MPVMLIHLVHEYHRRRVLSHWSVAKKTAKQWSHGQIVSVLEEDMINLGMSNL